MNVFLKLNNVCPFCKSESDFTININLNITIYDACKKGDKHLALELLNKKNIMELIL